MPFFCNVVTTHDSVVVIVLQKSKKISRIGVLSSIRDQRTKKERGQLKFVKQESRQYTSGHFNP